MDKSVVSETNPSVPETSVQAEAPEAPVNQAEMEMEKDTGEPNEAFFGVLLIGCLVLCLIAATGYFGLAGYRYFKQIQAEQAIPSIESLPKAEVAETVKEEGLTPSAPETPAATEKPAVVVDKKALALKVLNGGAVKGVAGTYVEKLKQTGFTKTTVGNAFGDYTGQTLYYAKGQEAGADVIKTEVVKTYPALVVKEALAGDKDAAAATFVLIIGR